MTTCRLCGATSSTDKPTHVPGCVGENPLLIEYEKIHAVPQAKRFFRFDASGTVAANAFDHRQVLAQKYAWAIPDETALRVLAEIAPIVEIGAGTGYWAALLRSRGVTIDAFDIAPPTLTSGANIYHRETRVWTTVREGSADVLKALPSLEMTYRSADGTIVCEDTWRQCCGVWWLHGPREALVERVFSECAPKGKVSNTTNGRCQCGLPLDRYESATLFLCWPAFQRTTMAVDSLRAFRGQRLVHVGEHNAEPGAGAFFVELCDGWALEREIEIPRWEGVQDSMTVWRRR